MPSLQRQISSHVFGIGLYNPSPEPSPPASREHSPAPAGRDELKVIPASELLALQKGQIKIRGTKRRTAWVFILGGLLGVLLASYMSPAGSIDRMYAQLSDIHFENFMDVLPAGLLKEVKDLQSSEKETVNYDSFAVGMKARQEGIYAKHPVIMIPGVISTGIESWGVEYFRTRLWGGLSMVKAIVMDKASWKRHIMLDETTGLDPPDIRLRAASGFSSADYFLPGYWIWSKILENLSCIGYDPNNAFLASYDWRMSYGNYEKRDGYYTKLKQHIEVAKQIQGEKVVLLSHSMGSQVLLYFMHWVEAEGYGNGGPSWVEDHIEGWINISGCMLGAVKDIPALMSGEMRDTVQLNPFAVYAMEKAFSRFERRDILQHFLGIASMLPYGGDLIWGTAKSAPDDRPGQNFTFGSFLKFPAPQNSTDSPGWLTIEESLDYFFKNTPKWFVKLVQNAYSFGVAHTKEEVEANQKDPKKWMNPLETRLPLAPSLKIYCFYGMGKPTERAYYYREDVDPENKSAPHIDTLQNTPDGFVNHGVVMGEGDGTVNLMSSGYMCNRGWKMKRYNPANISIVAYEMPHDPDSRDMRGGPNTGDHVDILGRIELNDLILRVAGGKGHLIQDRVVSDIRKYAARVEIYDEDEDRDAVRAGANIDTTTGEKDHPEGHAPPDRNSVADDHAPDGLPVKKDNRNDKKKTTRDEDKKTTKDEKADLNDEPPSYAERLLDEL